MASDWTTVRAADFIEFNPRLSLKKGVFATKVAMEKLQPFTKKIPATEQAEFAGGSKFCNGDTIMARNAPIFCCSPSGGTVNSSSSNTPCWTRCRPDDPTIDLMAIFLNAGLVAR